MNPTRHWPIEFKWIESQINGIDRHSVASQECFHGRSKMKTEILSEVKAFRNWFLSGVMWVLNHQPHRACSATSEHLVRRQTSRRRRGRQKRGLRCVFVPHLYHTLVEVCTTTLQLRCVPPHFSWGVYHTFWQRSSACLHDQVVKGDCTTQCGKSGYLYHQAV